MQQPQGPSISPAVATSAGAPCLIRTTGTPTTSVEAHIDDVAGPSA